MDVIDSRNALNAVLPEQFGKYSLLGHLATGGMAEVWLARQNGMEGFEKIVVIKRARPELTDSETTRQFLDEARLVATLQHPNIAQVYEIGTVGGSFFFVMEYVDGADLRRLIEAAVAKRHRVALADAIYILTHVCAALHYAHQKHDLDGRALQIIHRDVSPSNVLLSRDGAVKVCDFGVAKAHTRDGESTERGVLKGKFSYMSPEQCQDKPVDRRSDVFSIGILLYELTTLSKLFRGKSDYALLQQIVEARIAPPSSRIPGYPPELEHIVMKALAREPTQRYQTAQALQLDLEEFAREHKLAMSSVRIARLMETLFEKRNNSEWIRAQRAQRDQFMEQTPAPVGSGDTPAFLADGSGPSAPTADRPTDGPTERRSQPGSVAGPVVVTSTAERAPSQRSAALWLVGAAIAGLTAAAVTVADRTITGAEQRAVAGAIAADVERISSVFDASARSAHMRADGIATTPMLRAAIETDAATLKDVAATEMVFTTENGDAVEVYQFRGNKALSLLRLPKSAPALAPLRGRETKVQSDGRGVTLMASAPISGYRSALAGGIVIATPIDLTSIRRALDEHTLRASLTGLGTDLVLVERRDGGTGDGDDSVPVRLTVPSSAGWSTGAATLIATPKKPAGLTWAWQVRTMSGGLTGLLLIGFVVSLVRRPRT